MSSISKSNINSTTSSTDNGVLDELRRGPWTLDEDSLLIHYIDRHGEGRWNLLAKHSGLRRTGKSCRLRWLNYLKPDVKRGNLSSQEQLLILELHSKWGNRWSKIAQHLPGRTDNEIKNFWRTRVQKHARHLKINTNSTEFQDFIRSFWTPRLLQNIQASSCPTFSTINPDPFDHNSQQYPLPPPFQESTSRIIGTVPNIIDGQDLQNSDSEHCVGSCISSSESMNISQTSQFSEGCYYVDNGGYFDEFPVGDVCHIEENDWVLNRDSDAYNYMWNLDELWQFRNLQEREL